ncbi:hypothetical protein Tco_1359352 [Tanacetum coccineum]
MDVILRIFRYIKRTQYLGLWYLNGSGIKVCVYINSDHAGDYIDRKSTSGVCTLVGGCLTQWCCNKQTDLAISITEAEYVAAERACQQAVWMKQAIKDYDTHYEDILILCDNKGVAKVAKEEHSNPNHFITCKGVDLIFSTFNASTLELTDIEYSVSEHGASLSRRLQLDPQECIESQINEWLDEDTWIGAEEEISLDEVIEKDAMDKLRFGDKIWPGIANDGPGIGYLWRSDLIINFGQDDSSVSHHPGGRNVYIRLECFLSETMLMISSLLSVILMRKEVHKKISALILNQSQGCLFGKELKKKEPTS